MTQSLQGGCACETVRYRLTRAPMITHCCHCTWCQRESGSAFVINAVIESSAVELLGTPPEVILTPSESGKGQLIARCPDCQVAVWSHYPTAREAAAFIRVGTLDDRTAISPDVHIYTASKLPWVHLADNKPAFAQFYPDTATVWSPEALARWSAVMASRT
ncbi:GFA family protein [Hyphomonas sp.]|uniref:GFA family protein n=1 Tax=Hyphomonas sp. TaxID=87 RepID=UPI0025BCF023|nr:GFA family protein [Hyphomonas sp.]MBI1400806.1 aldehyde-activating protein [Hyphomonas sp.]